MQKSTAINTTIDMWYYTRNGGETIQGIYIHLSFIMTVSVKKPQVDNVFENIGFSNIWISSMVLLVSSRMEKYKCGRPRLVLKMNWSLLFYKRIVGVGGREIFYCLYLISSGASLFQLHMKKRKLLFWCYCHFKVSTSKVHDFDW